MLAEISGIGWITANGAGCAKDHESFAMTDGPLPVITPQLIFGGAYAPFRRMDEYSRLGFGAIAFALKDACLDACTEKRNIGIIASTAYGCLSTDMDYFDTVMSERGVGASPSLFSFTLPSIFLAEAAIRFGMTGTTFIINENISCGLTVLELALESILRGEADKMLCGVCNHNCPTGFEEICSVPPGALFLVVEAIPEKGSSYGKVGINSHGHIEFNKETVTDLRELVQRCLKRNSERANGWNR
ncbi:MAG: beta-ketoacyl synthase N-terminal-like domain-containing protein [Desulfobacterales bacterium]|nr:beta-ketoacyl synthase N-terminal-like domain-containing protein [Desulfobacterales bacterium]